MKDNRVWTLGAVVLSGAVLGAAWFLGVSPSLTQAAAATEAKQGVDTQNAAYNAQLTKLTADYAAIDALKADLTKYRLSVPDNDDVAAFVGGLADIQSLTGVTVTNVDVEDAKPFAPVTPGGEPVPAAAEAGEVDEAAAATAPTDAAAEQSAATVSPIDSIPRADLVSAANFVVIPITVSVNGGLDETKAFIGSLQDGERLFLVTKVTMTSDEEGGGFASDIAGYVYVLLDEPVEAAPTDGATAPDAGTAEAAPATVN